MAELAESRSRRALVSYCGEGGRDVRLPSPQRDTDFVGSVLPGHGVTAGLGPGDVVDLTFWVGGQQWTDHSYLSQRGSQSEGGRSSQTPAPSTCHPARKQLDAISCDPYWSAWGPTHARQALCPELQTQP